MALVILEIGIARYNSFTNIFVVTVQIAEG
jgi:hypothetical protein